VGARLIGVGIGVGLCIAIAIPGCVSERASSSLQSTELDESRVRLPVVLHFAMREDTEVVDPLRVGMWLAHAQALLEPHGIDVELEDVRMLPEDAKAGRFAQRIRLLSAVDDDRFVHVMVVPELGGTRRDGTQTVRGLHFRAPILRSQYVAVGPNATPSTMAHEIGHVFGLDHDPDPDNVMCSCDRSEAPRFTPAQGQRIRRAIRSASR
jgi:hypothetical protein